MSTWVRESVTACGDDCRYSGCPGHPMTIKVQDTADIVTFRIDDQELIVPVRLADALVKMYSGLIASMYGVEKDETR